VTGFAPPTYRSSTTLFVAFEGAGGGPDLSLDPPR
jgi:hypothetical protein